MNLNLDNEAEYVSDKNSAFSGASDGATGGAPGGATGGALGGATGGAPGGVTGGMPGVAITKGSSVGVKIAKNTIYQMVGKVVSMLITVSIVLLVTKNYGREGYGAFSLMQTWPALFFVIVDFGINAIATRELSKDWKKASVYFSNILLIRLAFSVFLIILLTAVLNFFPYGNELKKGIFLSLFLILTQALYTTTNIIFQVKLRYDLSVAGYLAGYLAIFVLALLLSGSHADVRLLSFSYVLGGAVTFLLNLFFVRKMGVAVDFKVDMQVIKYLLASSLPLGMMFVFSQINFKADSILLSVLTLPKNFNLTNIESVAVYSLPYKIFEVALVVPTFIMNSVFPVMVGKLAVGKKELLKLLKKSMYFLAGSAVLCSSVGVLLAPWIVNILGGSEFSQSVTVLRILLAGLIFYFSTQPIAWFIVSLDGQKYLPVIYLVSAIFNVSANYIFIQKYSYLASSVITHLSELLILILLIFTARKVWKEKNA